MVGGLAGNHAAQRVDPFIQLLAALLRRDGRVVRDIVGMAHEGIHGRNGIALRSRKDQEAVVEILGGGARDVTTNSVGGPQLERVFVHNSFPAAARASSHNLRGLERTGRRVSTSYLWRSMAFRISNPPRLNNSMSSARCLSTIFASGSPIRNHSRARATSNFIISRNAGVARRCAMSSSVTPYFARSSSGR